MSAEPIVKFFHEKLRFPRWAGSFAGILTALAMVGAVFLVMGALAWKQVQNLWSRVPQLTEMAQEGLSAAENQLLLLAARAPESAVPVLRKSVRELFSGSSMVLRTGGEKLLKLTTGFLGSIPGSAVGLGTGILASFMISLRLPKIKSALRRLGNTLHLDRIRPVLTEIRSALVSWGKAQLKLASITFSIVLSGLFLLRISAAPAIAAGITLVDAVPMLGTGTVLVPWAGIALLLGNRAMALGLLGIYGAAALTRSMLEPKFLGHHLGLDPLATLAALYLGFRLWGIPGMIFSPLAAVVALRLANLFPKARNIRSRE